MHTSLTSDSESAFVADIFLPFVLVFSVFFHFNDLAILFFVLRILVHRKADAALGTDFQALIPVTTALWRC